ncbi:MAG: hypothetical protein C0507_03345 [Cyanobacteria bacterium PR.3.49]|nr:hypothetical protein [Cyanobacteria bacterium PR.3.49]
MRIRNSLVQQGVFVIVFPLILQIVVVFLLSGQVSHIRDEQLKTAHARDMISMSYSLLLDTITAIFEAHSDSEQEGMVGVESTFKQLEIIEKEIETMRQKAGGRPEEAKHVMAVQSAARGLIEAMKWVSLQQAQGIHHWKKVNDKCYEVVNEGSKNMVLALEALVEEEELLSKTAAGSGGQNYIRILFLIALLNFALALGLGYIYVARIVRSLKFVDTNRALLAERKPLVSEFSAPDEIIALNFAMHSAEASLTASLEAGSRMIKDAPNLICSLDNDLLFLEVNPAAAKIIGINPEQLLGMSVREFIDNHSVEQLREAQSRQQESKLEIILTRQDGTTTHTHWSVNPGDAPAALFCVIQDISEQKHREGMRQRFLDAVRSSLRAPIASISESLQNVVASSQFQDSEQKSRIDLQRAERSARQCILLIDVLLDAQSAQTGSIQIETKRVSIAHVVEESVELVRTIADKKGVGLELEVIEKEVLCDPFKLTQTIVNFLSNAIKFSSKGDKIYVAIKEIDRAVEVSVTDEGPGISEEYRTQIFKPFVQVPGEKAKEGTGLGLAICKQIVDAHGGEIGVKPNDRGGNSNSDGASSRGTGSTFWFKIPV